MTPSPPNATTQAHKINGKATTAFWEWRQPPLRIDSVPFISYLWGRSAIDGGGGAHRPMSGGGGLTVTQGPLAQASYSGNTHAELYMVDQL